ncbi:glycosyltransferase family 2 protein [Patescibacteria group bacterium]|nr:glycosyltransferase family 2 protein [Patescibacteria group bacterium]
MMGKNNSHFLSLIVPVYKQEKIIVDNLHQIKKVLDTIRYDYEIIAVIDGHADRTFEKIKKARIPKVRTYSYKKNQGKSYAIRLGMHKAKGDYVMFLDSGMEIDPNGISMLLEHMEWYDADIIVGSKRHPVSHVNYSWQRKILSNGYYWFVKLLFGVPIRDTQAGIKIFRKKVIQQILPRLVEKQFAGDLEILVVAITLNHKRIFEAPIKMDYQLSSFTSAATLSAIGNIFIDTLAIWYRKNILRYYQKPHHKFSFPSDLTTFSVKR